MNEAAPLVSVIVTTFNRQNLVVTTVKSILTQTYRNIEIIVVLDGCTDRTKEQLVDLGAENLRIIEQDNSGGPARPRNTGIKYSKGRFVAFCDDDDLWEPTKVEKQVRIFVERPEVHMCHTDILLFNSSREWSFSGEQKNTSIIGLLFKNRVCLSSVMVRKDVFETVGNFDERKMFVSVEDYDMWLRICDRHASAFLPERLVRYRIHSNNISGNRMNFEKVTAVIRKYSTYGRMGTPAKLFWVNAAIVAMFGKNILIHCLGDFRLVLKKMLYPSR